ncbi:hypothetical protein E2K93_14750 [Thalassotalea sp. HSM 43]|uniref:hypothetical protein n=1 Tax=Thalassotalea sp. HSM 43 TaxID=2552945 RepID=UPI00108112CC|nr:hypothetical protein [Thalassotalea sp. HSM 43]QBY05553.1 hypothetical protein E2K93_14750 [Thalassotalea sp. HSM 43]
MLASLFKPSPLLDADSKQWLIDTFIWAVENFGESYFKEQSQLILPTNTFYPGKVSSVEEMTQLVFRNTLDYAGMQDWPISLYSPEQYAQLPNIMPQLGFTDALRGNDIQVSHNDYQQGSAMRIPLSFNPQQINQPQDLVATMVQQLSAALIQYRKSPIPGSEKLAPQAVDVVASVMGFGVIFANTAYQFKGGCGSCYNKMANRQASLPEADTVFTLALYCVAKGIDKKHVVPHLKSHLRGHYKKAIKELSKDGINDLASMKLHR